MHVCCFGLQTCHAEFKSISARSTLMCIGLSTEYASKVREYERKGKLPPRAIAAPTELALMVELSSCDEDDNDGGRVALDPARAAPRRLPLLTGPLAAAEETAAVDGALPSDQDAIACGGGVGVGGRRSTGRGGKRADTVDTARPEVLLLPLKRMHCKRLDAWQQVEGKARCVQMSRRSCSNNPKKCI